MKIPADDRPFGPVRAKRVVLLCVERCRDGFPECHQLERYQFPDRFVVGDDVVFQAVDERACNVRRHGGDELQPVG